jgi:hypothetical protein
VRLGGPIHEVPKFAALIAVGVWIEYRPRYSIEQISTEASLSSFHSRRKSCLQLDLARHIVLSLTEASPGCPAWSITYALDQESAVEHETLTLNTMMSSRVCTGICRP